MSARYIAAAVLVATVTHGALAQGAASGESKISDANGIAKNITVQRVRYVMGTLFEIRVRSHDEPTAVAAVEAAFAAIREADRLLSDYREDSETSRLNRAPAFKPVHLSSAMRKTLSFCEEMVRASGGAFDPTVGPLVRLWRQAADSGTMPSDAEYQRAKSAVGWSKLGFSGGQIKKTVDGVELDFGAYGKGEALDQAAIELRKFGIEDAYLSAGESVILALGNEADGANGWTVSLRDPLSPDGPSAAIVRLSGQALSTSAGYERDIIVAGKHYSHIVGPRNGLPVEGLAAASVVAPSAAKADALSTAVFVSGHEPAAKLLTEFHAAALLTMTNGKQLPVGPAPGSAEVFELRSAPAGAR